MTTKKTLIILFIIFTSLSTIFPIEVDSDSIDTWESILYLNNEFKSAIINAKSLEEVEEINELYETKFNVLFNKNIVFTVNQNQFNKDNIFDIISCMIKDMYLSDSEISLRFIITIKAKTNIKKGNIFNIFGYIFIYNGEEYLCDKIFLYDKNNNIIDSLRVEIEPDYIMKDSFGLMRFNQFIKLKDLLSCTHIN